MEKKSPYDIIKILIEKLILPKYPFLKISDIDSNIWGNYREYDVRFIVKSKPDIEIQQEIDQEIKSLFKMAGLDQIEKTSRNKIKTWFKTAREKNFSFHSLPGYHH